MIQSREHNYFLNFKKKKPMESNFERFKQLEHV